MTDFAALIPKRYSDDSDENKQAKDTKKYATE